LRVPTSTQRAQMNCLSIPNSSASGLAGRRQKAHASLELPCSAASTRSHPATGCPARTADAIWRQAPQTAEGPPISARSLIMKVLPQNPQLTSRGRPVRLESAYCSALLRRSKSSPCWLPTRRSSSRTTFNASSYFRPSQAIAQARIQALRAVSLISTCPTF
jgi:hypothetical protein